MKFIHHRIILAALYMMIGPNISAGVTTENQIDSAIDSPEIQSLNSKITSLQNSSNNWNVGYLVVTGLAVIVATAALYSQFRALQVTRELGSMQAQLDAAKERLAAQKIGQLNKSAAENNRLAGEANNKAGGAVERAAKLESANMILEAELIKLRIAAEPRRLTGTQKIQLADLLRPYAPDGAAIVSAITDTESKDLADDFDEALKSAGWETIRIPSNITARYGLSAGVVPGGRNRPGADILINALVSIGLKPNPLPYVDHEQSIPGGFQAGYIYLVVEHKPAIANAKKSPQ